MARRAWSCSKLNSRTLQQCALNFLAKRQLPNLIDTIFYLLSFFKFQSIKYVVDKTNLNYLSHTVLHAFQPVFACAIC